MHFFFLCAIDRFSLRVEYEHPWQLQAGFKINFQNFKNMFVLDFTRLLVWDLALDLEWACEQARSPP